MKKCNRCYETKPLEAFGKDRHKPDGLHPSCRACISLWASVPKGKKICSRCREIKQRSEFNVVGVSQKISRYCKPCAMEAAEEVVQKKVQQDRSYYSREREAIRDRQVWSRLKTRYGVTREWWEEQFEKQGGVCAICGKRQTGTGSGNRLHVDHCHNTGQVRGLLCAGCNTHLGILEKEEWRTKAEEYLKKWQS